MLTIYTTPSCSSCRKAKKWLEDYNIAYSEKNLFTTKITEEDIVTMLSNSTSGYDEIISTRSKIFKEKNIDLTNISLPQLKLLILENPSILKRPILVENEKIQVGYNAEEIRIFIPDAMRKVLVNSMSSESFNDRLPVKPTRKRKTKCDKLILPEDNSPDDSDED
ncbi:MAG: transcriptional regulator Spx [Acholeplasmatales bacterium]|jgi:regulatory protein spx|nr:transcriptional regulator Spx [Acholeplasmatales bacterium]